LETLQGALGSLTLDDVLASPHRDDEQVLLVSLQRLHRTLFRAERFKVRFPFCVLRMASDGRRQASTFITESDDPLCSSDHHMLPSDTLLEYDDSTPSEDPNNQPLDLGEISFMDLFTEPEPSQDTGDMVCDRFLHATRLINDPGHTSCNFHAHDQAAAAEILILQIIQFGAIGPEDSAGTGHLETNADLFTLAGLDDDWEPIDLQPNSTQREDSVLDYDALGCVALDLGDPSTEFPWHTSTCSDIPRLDDICAATMDQPVLSLDSDDEDMGEVEVVLDF